MRHYSLMGLLFLAACMQGPGETARPDAPANGVTISDDEFDLAASGSAPPAARPGNLVQIDGRWIEPSNLLLDEGNAFIISLAREYQDYAEFSSPPAQGGKVLGETLATLGPPSESGIWASAPFIKAPARGVIRDAQTGARVEAELRPSQSTGQMSLQAFQALGVDLREIRKIFIEEL